MMKIIKLCKFSYLALLFAESNQCLYFTLYWDWV